MSYMIAIILFALCFLCFFLYWFLSTEAYFGRKEQETVAEVMQVVTNKNGTVQYQMRFEDGKGFVRTALSAPYKENDLVKEKYKVHIRYVSFNIGKKAVLAVRLKKDGLQKADSFQEVIAAALLFGAVGVLYVLNI